MNHKKTNAGTTIEYGACCAPSKKFFTQGLWIEGDAEAQLDKSRKLKGAVGSFALPDLHPGKGIPIGCALATQGLFYPHLAGNDLGCGVYCGALEGAKRLSPDAMAKEKWLKNEPDFSLWDRHMDEFAPLWAKHGFDPRHNIRTIGGGNHFMEIGILVESNSTDPLLAIGSFVVLAHSGSRHLGEAAARLWTDARRAEPAVEGEELANEWMELHRACLDWAKTNRLALALSAAKTLGCDLRTMSDCHHNAIEKLDDATRLACDLPTDGAGVYLHRKGASKADDGLAVLPGSRGDFSFLLRPLSVEKSAMSLAHGAGRKWKRSDCQGRLSKAAPTDLIKTKLGSRVVCDNKDLLYEEAPQAYKDCASVLKALVEHGLAEAVAKIKPLLTLKI